MGRERLVADLRSAERRREPPSLVENLAPRCGSGVRGRARAARPEAQRAGQADERASRAQRDERAGAEQGRSRQSASAGGDRAARVAAGTPSPSRSSSERSVSGRVCTATIRRRPPQRGQCRTSRANTRLRSAAQSGRAGRADTADEGLSPTAGSPVTPADASAPPSSTGRGTISDRQAAWGAVTFC